MDKEQRILEDISNLHQDRAIIVLLVKILTQLEIIGDKL